MDYHLTCIAWGYVGQTWASKGGAGGHAHHILVTIQAALMCRNNFLVLHLVAIAQLLERITGHLKVASSTSVWGSKKRGFFLDK